MKECPQCGERYSDEATFCSKDASSLISVNGADLIGVVIDGRWRVESKLGEGGMGSVYVGRQTNIDRRVAIKTLRPELTSSPEFMARFEAEAKAAGRISNPHCVTIFESGRADAMAGMLYLVMEYLDGESLSDRLQRAPLRLEETLQVGIQIASGLAAAHEQGIIHRDLKPDNVFLVNVPGGELHAKVLDFGIAKSIDGDSKMTKSGMIMGTPQYMSPEQCHGQSVDVRSDIYSLGTMIYEMLSGRTPFNSPTPITVLFEVVNNPPPKLSELGVDVPEEVENYVMRMLSKSPDQRPSTAMEVRRTLEKLMTSVREVERSQNLAVASGPTLAVSPPMLVAEATIPIGPVQSKSSLNGLIGIAAILVVALLGTAAFLVWYVPGETPAEQAVPVIDEPIEIAEVEEEPNENLELSKSLLAAGSELSMAMRVAQFEADKHEPPVAASKKRSTEPKLAESKADAKVEEKEVPEPIVFRPVERPVDRPKDPVTNPEPKKETLRDKRSRWEKQVEKSTKEAERLGDKARELEKTFRIP